MQIKKDYKLQGTLVEDVPMVGNIRNDELGEIFLRRLNEVFKGNSNIAYTDRIGKDQPLPFSNIPRNLYANQVIEEETGNTHIQSPEEMVRYWEKLEEKSTTYADSSAVSVFPRKGPNETLRKRVLDILGKDKIKTPLLVAGLGVKPSDNDYGFNFIETPYLRVIQAPYLTKDQRVKYDPETKTLVPTDDNTGVYIWTSNKQSGLRGACHYWYDVLIFRDDDLLVSSLEGRVPFFKDPQGSAEKIN